MNTNITRILVGALALVCSLLQAAEPARVLIVVGPSNHPPGTHEVVAGGRLMPHFYRTLQYAMALGYAADCNANRVAAALRHPAALPSGTS